MLIYTRQTAWSSPNVGWPMNHPRILNTGQRWLAMNTGRLLMSGLPSVTQAMASNGLASAQADEALQVFFHTLKTDDLPPSLPRPPSCNTRIPSITATLMATTTQTTTHAPTIGCSSGGGGSGLSGSGGRGGGPPGGGGPPSGGGPPGGAPGPGPGQAGGGAKLVGNPPQVFDGTRNRTQLFLSKWEIYWGLNYTADIMAQPYTRVLCFLSYI